MKAVRFLNSDTYPGYFYIDSEGEPHYPAAEVDTEIARLKNENGEQDSKYQDRMLDMEGRHNAYRQRVREVLQKISAWGCNGQCVALCGTKCPCCMAQAALAALGEDGG